MIYCVSLVYFAVVYVVSLVLLGYAYICVATEAFMPGQVAYLAFDNVNTLTCVVPGF